MEDCTGCGKKVTDGVKFPCPKCGVDIRRCERCRNLSVEYVCPKCGYIGP
jgi:Zn-ribbon RNA-binding protein